MELQTAISIQGWMIINLLLKRRISAQRWARLFQDIPEAVNCVQPLCDGSLASELQLMCYKRFVIVYV